MTSEPERTVDVPLLRKALEWAEAEAEKPEELRSWDQAFFAVSATERLRYLGALEKVTREKINELVSAGEACGTVYCLAGYVNGALCVDELEAQGREFNGSSYNARGETQAEVAAELLGIEPPVSGLRPEPGHLFAGSNSIEDVRRIAESLAGEKL